MPVNNFLPFCPDSSGTNLLTNSEYAASAIRTDGNQPGVASAKANNKAIRQSSFITSQLAQFLSNVLTQDVVDADGGEETILKQMTAAFTILPPTRQTFLSGSGTYNLSYKFFITAGAATVGATYTNNTFTFTVKETIAAGTILWCTGTGAPAVSGTLTKASGTGDATITFQAFRKPIAIYVDGVAGGGGGLGSGTAAGTAAGSGGNTTFGTALISLTGGGAATDVSGGPGGAASLGTGPLGLAIPGGSGQGSSYNATVAVQIAGGTGGASIFGGNGRGGTGPNNVNGFAGAAGATNSGAGGGGAGNGTATVNTNGGGGGAGGGCHALIYNPDATYAYAIGAGGAAGGAGTGGAAGGAGAAGALMITEIFQ